MNDIATVDGGKLRLNFHPGQLRAWNSNKRCVLVLAGTQGGKTVFGPYWLWREIQLRGPGEYMVIAPTYPLLAMKALPSFLHVFRDLFHLGKYVGSPIKKFAFSADGARRTFGGTSHSEPTTVYFGHASDSNSLESATVKGLWFDEAGQPKCKSSSHEALDRRLAINRGRKLLTTTPYNLGYLKKRYYDPWEKSGHNHPDIDIIQFKSTLNPAFPAEEFERARDELPQWKFNLFYCASFVSPAGLIYKTFNEKEHVCPRFSIPPEWRRFVGLDLGGVNTAAIFFAAEQNSDGKETSRFFAYREYHTGNRTAEEHAKEILKDEPRTPTCFGGSSSEGQWRLEFAAAGLPVGQPAVSSVSLGIDRVHGAHSRGEIIVMNHLEEYLKEKRSYSYVTDEDGNALDEIENKKTYHLMDAERYVISSTKSALIASVENPFYDY